MSPDDEVLAAVLRRIFDERDGEIEHRYVNVWRHPRDGYLRVDSGAVLTHAEYDVVERALRADPADMPPRIDSEHSLVVYDISTPVQRRVVCSCGWEATRESGRLALGEWHRHLASHGVA